MGSDEEEGSAKKGEGDSHSPFGLDLRDDPGCDCGMLHLCVGRQNKCWGCCQSYNSVISYIQRQKNMGMCKYMSPHPFIGKLLLAINHELASDSNII